MVTALRYHLKKLCLIHPLVLSITVLFTTGELVQEEPIRVLTDGVALALVRDPTRSLPWLVTTTALYQVLHVLCIPQCDCMCAPLFVRAVEPHAVPRRLCLIVFCHMHRA
jgi:hypothetical protein